MTHTPDDVQRCRAMSNMKRWARGAAFGCRGSWVTARAA